MKLNAGHFYGKTSQTMSANGFRFTEKTYSSTSRLPGHSHELAHFCFVLRGNYHETIGSRTFGREPMSLVFYPSDVSHAEDHLTDGRHFLVEIDLAGLERVREFGARLDEPTTLGADSQTSLAARMYREFRERDRFSPLALECISNELLIAASRKLSSASERRPPQWLETVKEYLRENYSEQVGLTELALAAGVHPTHLARVFRQFERCTAGDYVRAVRIRNAQKRLLLSKQPLADIALDAGFADQTHFTRSFKRATGMTPSEFRRIFAAR